MMELDEAFAYIDSLNLKSEPFDFTKATDEEVLKTSINIDLSSIEEALRFVDELKSRNLYEKYYEIRRSKKKRT